MRSAFAGRFDGGSGGIDVFVHTSGKPADHRPLNLRGNRVDGLEVTITDHREPGFDHIDVQPAQLAGDFHFFAQVHAGARALFAIAQRRIKNSDLV